MKKFFLNENTYIPFKLGGIIHIVCILFLVISLYLIYRNRNKIKNIKHKKTIKVIMCLIMYLNMFIYYTSLAYYGVYDLKLHLSLHICFISGILFMIYLLTNHKKIYKMVYFFSIVGPLPAILLPDLKTSFDSYVFYQFFISHHLFIIFSYFILYLDSIHIEFKDALKSLFTLICIFITMAIFNNIFGTNYIMSKSFPNHVLKLFPFVKSINPFIILTIVGILMFVIAYIPIYFKNKEELN